MANRLHWGTGRLAFLAHQETIKQMLALGHTQLAIYSALEQNLNGLSYSQFSQHVRTYIIQTPAKLKAMAKERIVVPQQNQPRNLPMKNFFPSFEPGPKVPDLNELW